MQPELMGKLSELKRKRQEINQLMYGKRNLLDIQYRSMIDTRDKKYVLKCYTKISDLHSEIQKYEKDIEEIDKLILKLRMLDWNLIGQNEKIDLYKTNDELKGNYYIYVHETIEEAGMISYEPKYKDTIFGDISYIIEEEYQGNGYAYEALCMLCEHLKNNKVSSIRISVRKQNIPSLKTIEKYEKINDNVNVSEYDGTCKIFDFKLRNRLLKR